MVLVWWDVWENSSCGSCSWFLIFPPDLLRGVRQLLLGFSPIIGKAQQLGSTMPRAPEFEAVIEPPRPPVVPSEVRWDWGPGCQEGQSDRT